MDAKLVSSGRSTPARIFLFIVAVAIGTATSATARAEPFIHPYGYIQPQLGWAQQDSNPNVINPQTSGFSIRRGRLGLNGGYNISGFKFEAQLEAELSSSFQLLDAFVSGSKELVGKGFLQLKMGQMLTPFSRQYMTSSWQYQMIDYSLIAGSSYMPQRQIGLQFQFNVPYAPWVELQAGVYNGEGTNVIQNVDKNFMYVARLALRPLNPRAVLAESGFGDTQVSVAFNVSYNAQTIGSTTAANGTKMDTNQTTLLLGTDVFASWKGASFYGEFVWGRVTYTDEPDMPSCYDGVVKRDHCLRGFNLQAGYLLPIPGYLYRKFEVAARFEEYEPNARIAIEGPGSPDQTRGSAQGIINFYQFEHSLKAQLAYSHNFEISKLDRNNNKADYDNDTVMLQLTARLWL